jgi:hypothetical protein
MGKLACLAAGLVAVAMVIWMAPEVSRYLKIRSM